MAKQPFPTPLIDWTAMLESYHEGDKTLAHLRQFAEQTALPDAAAETVRAAVEVGEALVRKARADALRKRIQEAATAARPRATLPIEMSPVGRRLRHALTAAMPQLAADGAAPPDDLKALCDVPGKPLRVSSGNQPPREIELQRYLTDEWSMVISLIPGREIATVHCGPDAMSDVAGVFVLPLPERTPAAVLDVCTRDLTIQFRDGQQLSLLFV